VAEAIALILLAIAFICFAIALVWLYGELASEESEVQIYVDEPAPPSRRSTATSDHPSH
jgi:hypothetical protein